MKICLTAEEFLPWQGGRDFLRMLIDGLRLAARPEDVVTIKAQSILPQLAYHSVRLAGYALLGKATKAWRAKQPKIQTQTSVIKELGSGRWKIFWEVLWDHKSYRNFDVAGPVRWAHYIPTDCAGVGYIADLQHRVLPDFFTPEECAHRDVQFQDLINAAPVIIVNAATVRDDLHKYYSIGKCEIVALPFAPSPKPEWLAPSPDVRPLYGVSEPYFICSNQFWKHKNLEIILQAVALAAASGDRLCVVFTGATEDYRHPEYFEDLKAYIADAGIGDRIHILGLIPKAHQIQLMRKAIAVVQPTLFEGGPGGGSIFDAIAVGQRSVVSDIPVNREIGAEVTRYFDPYSAASLLEAMIEIRSQPHEAPSPEALIARGQSRREEMGRVLRGAFQKAVESKARN